MESPIAVKLPAKLISRVDALKAALERADYAAIADGGQLTRAAVIRLALARGLAILERESEEAWIRAAGKPGGSPPEGL